MSHPRTVAIVNPRAATGKTGRRWPALARRLGAVDGRFTQAPNHATTLTREALGQGYQRIIAVGGDGTINEVVNGFFDTGGPVNPEAELAVLPLGTGSDFQRSLGIKTLDDAVTLITSGEPGLATDAARIRYVSPAGATESRYFVNLASFGMGGAVALGAKNFLSPVSGKAAFLWATLEVFFRYRAPEVELKLDSHDAGVFEITNIAAGNGRFHGGGMHVCPRAVLDDGWLDVTVIRALSGFELIRDLPVLYSDNIYQHPKTAHFRARRIEAQSRDSVAIEVDGEPLGKLPVAIEILPGALRVLRRSQGKSGESVRP